MKIYKILTVLLLLVSLNIQAQEAKKEKIKALKTAFFTTELSLTTVEAEKFWPVYNTFDDNQFELRFRKMRAIKAKLESPETLSEKEAQSLLSQMESTEDDLYESRKKLIQQLKTILPASKIIKLKKAEDDFNRTLLKQYRGKRGE